MLKIIISEIEYHKNSILALGISLPFLALYSRFEFRSITAHYILFWSFFIIAQRIIIIRDREQRTQIANMLPLSRNKYAIFRVLSITIYSVTIFGSYALISLLLSPSKTASLKFYIILTGIVLLVYSLYFLIKDLSQAPFSKLGITPDRFIMFIILFIVGIQLMLLTVYLRAKAGQLAGFHIGLIFDWLIANHPFRGDSGWLKFIITALVSAILTLPSYQRKKSYLK